MDLKQTNDVVVSIFPFKYILKNIYQKKLFPLSGISNKLTVYCKKKENKKFVTYKSDRFGFRNDDSNWDEINVDFVLLGDSFVQGSCVDSDSTINSQLSNIYNSKLNKKINTINLGLNGNGPLLEYAILKEYLKYTETEKVLYFFYEGNDLENFDIELNDPFLKKYLNYDFEQELIKKQADIDIINYNLLEEELNKKHIAFLDFIKLKKLRILINNIYRNYSKNQISKSSKETYKHYNNILVNLKKLTESQNTELYFIYMPYISRFSNYNSDQNYEDYSKIMSMVKKLDIKYIDILSKFKTEVQDPLSLYQLRKYQHLNESGYKFVAETIIKEIN